MQKQEQLIPSRPVARVHVVLSVLLILTRPPEAYLVDVATNVLAQPTVVPVVSDFAT